MAQIVPAILEQTLEGFLDKVARVTKLSGVERIQVDFGDGVFIKNQLLAPAAIQPLNPAFHWEAHLMVKEPKDFFDYKIAGFKTIFVHYEAFDNSRDLHQAIEAIKSEGLKPALAVNPGTPVEVFKDFEKTVSHFLLMGVNPGAQGQEFLADTIRRIGLLRKLIPNGIIEVDGGINISNAKEVAKAGADLIVVGSAIVRASDINEAWEKLRLEVA